MKNIFLILWFGPLRVAIVGKSSTAVAVAKVTSKSTRLSEASGNLRFNTRRMKVYLPSRIDRDMMTKLYKTELVTAELLGCRQNSSAE
ncbi:hypothetical protein EDC01DRAFT_677254 [Geopyxis carbonaria]|nr:hypothetical protein EDC01DRAFT_677254 [Geopyxis carbonaria]